MTTQKLLQSANYVRSELPIRLSRRIRDIQNLPFIVGANPHIESYFSSANSTRIYHLYYNAFAKFRQVQEIKSLQDNHEFYLLLKNMLNAHNRVISELATGIRETSHHLSPVQSDKFLSSMIKSRIGRRVIAQQHMAYSEEWYGDRPRQEGVIGMVHTNLSAYNTVLKATELAGKLFREEYQISPPKVRHVLTKLGGYRWTCGIYVDVYTSPSRVHHFRDCQKRDATYRLSFPT
jgi:pyruvate dehydrogenase kinase 2/3/4